MTFLKTLLIILLVYFGLKILIRLVFPYFMRYIAKKAGEKMEQAFNPNYQAQKGEYQNETKKDGNVVIDKIPQKPKNSNKPVGDYVDYEEID